MRARVLAIIPLLLSLAACATTSERQRVSYVPADTYVTSQELDSAGAAQGSNEPVPLWPRVFQSGDTVFATYEPTITSWKDDKLQARVAVEVYPNGAQTPKYGEVWFECPTQTDRARGIVTLGDIRITQVRFPTAASGDQAAYAEALRGAELAEAKTVAIDRLQREVEYGAVARAAPAQPVDTAPPAIVVTDRPTTLVQVDGTPQLRKEGEVERVVNTRALLLAEGGVFYLWLGDRWYRATSIEGEYTETRDVPAAVDAARARLATSDAKEQVRAGTRVVVTTKPSALIETRGAPTYEPIAGTTLSWVSNTDADVLRDEASGQTYVLLGGRWFRAGSLSGPWTFVLGRDVPATFRNIPRDHREARVLASIPDTPEAEEAKIAASIPQTAVVDRSRAQLSVKYEGEPDFRPIEGTSAPISYAVNASTPVIAASDGLYYAVENGVWFVATSPDGPWTVATSVPDVIYSIPPSSPVHYVTYVRVYGYSPEYAYVGYYPGYVGVFYTGGVIALGAGFDPWFYGPYAYGYYGYPVYYGYPRYYGYHGYPRYPGFYGYRAGYRPGGAGGVYHRWAPTVVHAPPAYPARPRVEGPPGRVPASPSVGPRGPMVTAPSYVPRRSTPPTIMGPRYSPAPPSAGVPRTSPPTFTAPPYRPAPPSMGVPRSSPPTFTAPSYRPPAPGAGVIPSNPGGAARVVPPSFAPPARGAVPGGAIRSAPPRRR